MTTSSAGLSSIALVSVADLDAMDLETAIQLVQSQKCSLFEEQLKDQVKELQGRNLKISELNATLSSARELMSQFGEKHKSDEKISNLIDKERDSIKGTNEWKEDNTNYKAQQKEINKTAIPKLNNEIAVTQQKITTHTTSITAIEKEYEGKLTWTTWMQNWEEYNQRINPFNIGLEKSKEELIALKEKKSDMEAIKDLVVEDSDTKSGALLENIKSSANQANLEIDVKNKGELQTLVENIKSIIDSLGNSQQMDMLRMQGYSNKRNESFETRSTMMKKQHDMNQLILRNLS